MPIIMGHALYRQPENGHEIHDSSALYYCFLCEA